MEVTAEEDVDYRNVFGFDIVAQLPMEILVHILTYVSHYDLLRCYMVCSRWRMLLSSDVIWKRKYKSRWPSAIQSEGQRELMNLLSDSSTFVSWRSVYINRSRLVNIWRKNLQVEVDTLDGAHSGCITSVQVHGDWLFSASRDGTLKVWDLKHAKNNYDTGKCVRSSVSGVESLRGSGFIDMRWQRPPENQNTTPKEDREGSGTIDGGIGFTLSDHFVEMWTWNGQRLSPRGSWRVIDKQDETDSGTAIVGFDAGDQIVVTAESGTWQGSQKCKIWNLGTLMGEILYRDLSKEQHTESKISKIRFVEDRMELYVGSVTGTLQWYDLRCSPDDPDSVMGQITDAHAGEILTLEVGENIMISGAADRTIKIWDLRVVGRVLSNVKVHRTPLQRRGRMTAMKMKDNLLVSAWNNQTITISDILHNGKDSVLCRFMGHDQLITCVEITPSRLFSGSADDTIKVWTFSTPIFQTTYRDTLLS